MTVFNMEQWKDDDDRFKNPYFFIQNYKTPVLNSN